MSRFLLFFYFISLSTHSIASRNPYADREDYGGGGNFGLIFLFTVVPILFWAISEFLKKNSANKSIEYERKLREHTDQIVKEFAEKNKVQAGQKNNIPPKKDEPKSIVITPELIKKPSKIEEKPQVKKEFPKLTEQEREYALFFLGMDKFGAKSIKCHKCGRIDFLGNYDDSSAGSRFRYCNICNSHFEIDLPGIEELEAKLIDVFYLRCLSCGDIVKRVDLLDSSAGDRFKKCPSCQKYNFQTYELSKTWYENLPEEIGEQEGDEDSHYYPKSRIALVALSEFKKEKRRLKNKKRYIRGTPYLRHCGWLKRPHKNRYDTRRRSKTKLLIEWWINRQPRVFT